MYVHIENSPYPHILYEYKEKFYRNTKYEILVKLPRSYFKNIMNDQVLTSCTFLLNK